MQIQNTKVFYNVCITMQKKTKTKHGYETGMLLF